MSICYLKEIGALDSNEDLTPLGAHIASLPLDARIGKFLLFGCMLRCISSVLTIAAAMSSRSPFLGSIDKREDVQAVKEKHASGKSDHVLLLKLYDGAIL